jgi:hypothetical protein
VVAVVVWSVRIFILLLVLIDILLLLIIIIIIIISHRHVVAAPGGGGLGCLHALLGRARRIEVSKIVRIVLLLAVIVIVILILYFLLHKVAVPRRYSSGHAWRFYPRLLLAS